MKKSIRRILGILIFVLIIVIAIIVVTFKKNNRSEDVELEIVTQKHYENLINIEKDVILEKLNNMKEIERIEYYASQFLKAIENEKFEKAYDMLYDDFKNNYFPTMQEFENFAKQNLAKVLSVNFTNVEKNGDIYIIYTEIVDSLTGNEIQIEKIIVREEEIGKFVMSFSFM